MSDTDSINTFNSWASDLTTCEPLEKVLSSFNGNNKFQRRVLELVTSMKNSIAKRGGTETSTEFYAAMISILGQTELDVDTMEACVYILKHLLRQSIPAAVIRHTTSVLSKIILELLSDKFCKNEIIVQTALFCLSKLIAAQTDDSWKLDNITHLYRVLFSFTTDSRKTINKHARKAVLLIFSSKCKSTGLLSKKHPLNKETIKVLTNSITLQNKQNKKRDTMDVHVKPSPEDDNLSFSLSTLGLLLKSNLFDSESTVMYLETLIQCLLSLQIIPIQCQILNILSELFVGRILLPEQIGRCLTSLFGYLNICSVKSNCKLSSSPVPSSFIGGIWLNTVLMGFESLLLNDQSTFLDSTTNQTMECRVVAMSHATHLVKLCCDWLVCDSEELQKAALAVLGKLCSCSLVTSEFKDNYLDPERFSDVDICMTKWAEIISRLLLLNNSVVWTQCIDNLIHLLVKSDGKCEKLIGLMIQILPQIVEMRDSYEDTEEEVIASLTADKLRNVKQTLSASEKVLRVIIESFVGTIIKFYGFGKVVQVLPLTNIIGSDDSSIDLLSTRTWIVPLIKMYTEGTSLDQFRVLIWPVIQLVTKKIDSLTNTDQMETEDKPAASSAALVTLGVLRYQLWSCLPSFAKRVIPGGIEEVSSRFIDQMETGQDSPRVTLWNLMLNLLDPKFPSNLEVIVLATVRNLVKTAQNQDEMKATLTSGVLFPQILQHIFSMYMKNDKGIQANVKATLAVYLPLFEPQTFEANCNFIINKKLADVDIASPTTDNLCYIELLIILGPHLTESMIQVVCEFLVKFLDNHQASNQLQKRVYRFFEIISQSSTDTSNEFTKRNLTALLDKFHSWTKVKTDSWKCRMKSLYNFFKLMNEPAQVSQLLNGFLSEILSCLNIANKKTRAVSGLLLVEGIIACSERSEDEISMSDSIDKMLQQIILCLRDKMNDNTSQAIQFKGALAKALYLILSENRLSRSVSRKHIVDTMAVITDIFSNHNSNNSDRHLVMVALDILAGLLKKKTSNFNNIYMVDVGQCINAARADLRMKVRTPIKRILKKMLKLWDYENIKKCIPDDLVAVLRNIHKSMNRSKRANNSVKDHESCATSWGGISETASQQTMKNPHIKNIAELLDDTDSEDDDLKTRFTGTTLGNKSVKSTTSRASELRKIRKRKIDSANATLHLEENIDDIVDLSDPTSMVRNLRLSDKKTNVANALSTKTLPNVDKRGFHFEGGRLVIGKANNGSKPDTEKGGDDDGDNSENEHYKSEKERFQPVKKRMRKEKLPGSEYKSFKKGVFGDMKRKDKPDPYAYIPFKNTDQCHSVMKNYEQETRKALKAARQMSKSRNKERSNKK